jgi:hypothetical protein
VDNSKCKKVDNGGCTEEDGGSVKGNPCKNADFEPECKALDVCQWCDAQSKCKKADAICESPSGEVDLDLGDEGARFAVRDEGLGGTDPNTVSVALKYLFEIAEDGETQVGQSLVDLEFQEFEVKQVVGTFFEGIEARKISFEASIAEVGKIELDTYIMRSNGTINTSGGESWVVEPGDVKFNIIISDWSFCSTTNQCGDGNETGQFLDVAVQVQGNSDSPEQSAEDALLFNLGGGVPLILSKQVVIDDFSVEMPEGFPRVEMTAEGALFVFRFPRFQEYAVYDPIVEYTQATYTTPPSTSPTTTPNTTPPTPSPITTQTTSPTIPPVMSAAPITAPIPLPPAREPTINDAVTTDGESEQPAGSSAQGSSVLASALASLILALLA